MGDRLSEIRTQLSEVPDLPGVYLWKDVGDEVLYVGKAKALRKRMIQYVSGHDERAQIPLMMAQVASFDYIVARSEHEALILEINLVKKLDPPFNVDLKDDKSFPYIAITLGSRYPAIKYTREKHVEQTRYFGPYTDAKAARSILDTLRRLMPMCRCTCPEWRRIAREEKAGKPFAPTPRPCFDSLIGLGPGVCKGGVDPDEYRIHVEKVVDFLRGHYGPLEKTLRALMDEASADLDFEAAAGYRNRIDALEQLKEKQTVISDRNLNLDVIGTYREETIAGVYVLVVRNGRVLNRNEFVLDKGLNVSIDDLLSGFITRHYAKTTEIPKTIALEVPLHDGELLEAWLSDLRQKSGSGKGTVRFIVPQRGVKHELLEMAIRNARHALMRWMMRTHYEDERLNDALMQLESALALNSSPYRIECYDISTLHGTNSVGSMVVFTGGKKDPAAYRRFRIRMESAEANDVAMMREVLGRRFSRPASDDSKFARTPDLIVIDGGKPQLNAARAVLEELGQDIEVVGLAKREEEIFTSWQDQPVILPQGAPSLYLIKRLRDEAHRFAIEYHRLLRSKAMTASILDEIIGIGPKKRKELVRHFGSFAKLKAASVDEIAQVKGITDALAYDVYSLLHIDEQADCNESQDKTIGTISATELGASDG